MIDDITEFLPKYPNIDPSKQPNLNPYNTSFETAIYEKKEFNQEKLSLYEPLPAKGSGELLKHQKVLSRFLSSRTPYNGVLLVHYMGSGKTGVAIASIEQIKRENSTINGAVILAKGEGLLHNFEEEIIKTTGREYIPDNYEILNPNQKIRRVNKLVRKFYTIMTFYELGKELASIASDEYIRENYSNKVYVFDEIHNMSNKEEVNGNKIMVYKQIHRMLHLVDNCKVILMSGTPLRDSIAELPNLLNLILPMDEQLPVRKNFIEQYFDSVGGFYIVKPEKKMYLKNKMRGIVSYLQATSSDIKKIFVGEKIGSLKYFKVYPDTMSEFQTEGYQKAYLDDIARDVEDEEKKGAVYLNSREASLFVFPDGSWAGDKTAKTGFYKYVNMRSTHTFIGKKSKKTMNFSMLPQLRNVLKGKTNEETLENVRKYSSKFASAIEVILRGVKEGKKTFIYCEYVLGSGSILFSLILELFGFSNAYGGERDKKLRYAIVNNQVANYNKIIELKNQFNLKDNIHGEIVNVMIGSRVVSEGFSLLDVQQEIILTPHWNYSETDQAIARGYRFGSHKNLLEAGIVPTVEVYQMVSIPFEGSDTESIDLKLYETSEIKDINIKRVHRLMKEASFDCALNYDRNRVTGKDGERECEYQSCEYYCDNIDPKLYVLDKDSEIKPYEKGDYVYIFSGLEYINHYGIVDTDNGDTLLVNVLETSMSYNIIDTLDIPKENVRPAYEKDFITDNIIAAGIEPNTTNNVTDEDNTDTDETETDIENDLEEEYTSSEDDEKEIIIGGKKIILDDSDSEDSDSESEDMGDIDPSTYQLYYNTREIQKLITSIVDLYGTSVFSLHLQDILKMFTNHTSFEVLTALDAIISKNITIFNIYGLPCYLKEENNIYYLTTELIMNSNFYSLYYLKNQYIDADMDYNKVIDDLYHKNGPNIIKHIFDVNTEDNMKNILSKIPSYITANILENCLIAELKGVTKNKLQRDLILSIFKSSYRKVNTAAGEIIFSTLMYDTKHVLRCLNTTLPDLVWHDCSVSEKDIYSATLEIEQEKVKANEYGGYYGIYNKDFFCIRKPDVGKKNARDTNSGRVCSTWNKEPLYGLILKIFKIPIPAKDTSSKTIMLLKKLPIKEIKSDVKKTKYFDKLYTKDEMDALTDDNYKTIYYWFKQTGSVICNSLREFLDEKGLLVQDHNCGVQEKVKKKK